MGPSSLAVQLIMLGIAVGSIVALSLTWDRHPGRRLRYVVRSAAVAGCLLGMLASVGVWVNREVEAYQTWGALVGTTSDLPPAPAPVPTVLPEPLSKAKPRIVEQEDPSDRPPPRGSGESTVVAYKIKGAASGVTLDSWAYLPAAYHDPAHAKTRFPVIVALHGFPGSPHIWMDRLQAQSYLDLEIGEGRMAPVIVLFAWQTTSGTSDTECTDLTSGMKAETYLTVDVPADTVKRFRARADRNSWGLIGYSAGGFCAMNLTLRHPDKFIAGASLSGYGNAEISIGDGTEKTYNDPAWRLHNLPQPPVSLWWGSARDDGKTLDYMNKIVGLVKPPLSLTTALVKSGGHTQPVWRKLSAPAFDWLSGRLARPSAEPS